MLIVGYINVARIALDIGIELTNPCWHFFVPDLNSSVARLRSEVCRSLHELCGSELTSNNKHSQHSFERQHFGDSRETEELAKNLPAASSHFVAIREA